MLQQFVLAGFGLFGNEDQGVQQLLHFPKMLVDQLYFHNIPLP